MVSGALASKLNGATTANWAASAETWPTTGLTNPNKQRLTCLFTPQQAGYAIARIRLFQRSKTIYACPKLVAEV